jgi:hypothetical protein
VLRYVRFTGKMSPRGASGRRLDVDTTQPLAYASGYDANRLTPKAQHQNLRFGLQWSALRDDSATSQRASGCDLLVSDPPRGEKAGFGETRLHCSASELRHYAALRTVS